MTDLTEITMVAETQDLVQKALQLQEQLDKEKAEHANSLKTIEKQKEVIVHLQNSLDKTTANARSIMAERDTIVGLIKEVVKHVIVSK